MIIYVMKPAGVVELADASDSKSNSPIQQAYTRSLDKSRVQPIK